MLITILVLSLAAVLAIVAFFLSSRRPPPAPPRLRACPICGKELAIGENIIAERMGVKNEGREKIMIKGCPYCLGRKSE